MKEFKKVKNHLKCLYCDKTFAREDIMKKHERTHTDEKPYICLQCILGTSRNSTCKPSKQNLHEK